MPELSVSEWDKFLTDYPDVHLLQTDAWGELKAAFGWDVTRVVAPGYKDVKLVGAQVFFHRLPLGFTWAYIPKGPVGEASGLSTAWSALLPEVDQLCRQRKAVFLKVEPDLWEPGGEMQEQDASAPSLLPGLRSSPQSIQPPRTLLVDLRGDDEQILGRMKQKTRYNVRLALKKGVVVSTSSDVETFHRLMVTTGKRDAFGVHSLEYYCRAYELFYPRGECELLVAEYQGEPLAALMVFARGSRAWYIHGASSDAHRDRMPTYILQWEAMRWARARGCTSYDLWGVPDVDEQTLEANFTQYSEGLWGVYRFKRGFGGTLRRAMGPWDRVYNPIIYFLYVLWVNNRQRFARVRAG